MLRANAGSDVGALKILVVAMLDSIHTARWLAQLRGTGWDVHLFPSTPSAAPHPDLSGLTVYGYGRRPAGAPEGVKWRSLSGGGGWLGRVGRRLGSEPSLPEALSKVFTDVRPDIVHSLETQAAGYLTLGLRRSRSDFPPWLVSIWGSDLYLFGKLAAHREHVREVLATCDALHAECRRDVRIGRELGFAGLVTDSLTASAGFDIPFFETLRSTAPPSRRREISVKGYQGWAGRALFALRALEIVAPLLNGYRINLYLPRPEVAIAAELLVGRTGLDIEIHLLRRPHVDILRMHGRSRVSIGVSISDGISASMVEAMAMGSLPVQSDTGCGCEWLSDGEGGLLVPPESPEQIAAALQRALTDDAFVDRAAAINWETCRTRLDSRVLMPKVVEMYRGVAGLGTRAG
jgi:hypothetical protein